MFRVINPSLEEHKLIVQVWVQWTPGKICKSVHFHIHRKKITLFMRTKNITGKFSGKTVTIFSDSQAALKALDSNKVDSSMAFLTISIHI